MTADSMRVAARDVLRLAAVASGLGLVWFVGSSGALDSGAVTALALAATALAAGSVAAASVASVLRALGAVLARFVRASARPRPADDVDLPVTVVQSRPDAPGRPRTRAPGRLLAAA
jgi:hypothetical protein